ncbi:hypothetical protein BDQ12DRAFT_761164 [Crucibulum laeve]|uniref:Protein kinase domain-containing protein n=1 Tax=Crucibulum laeve TaxID=68775 RepID=A0A5C3LRH4_9AGAR|nr:hypothetical protein BDQ12DRAFT_761164 [Crucibulum laeve]
MYIVSSRLSVQIFWKGMSFMHSHLVAHEDLTTQNIMMDARPLYPQGWHFVDNNYSLDGNDHLTPLARIDNPVRYYIIDYDCSVHLKPGQPHLIQGDGGRDPDVPELMELHPFDPFKVDVFTVGNMLFKEFYRKYLGVDFLSVLINNMMAENPEHRPTAEMALAQWNKIKAIIKPSTAHNRLRKPDESMGERVVLNTVAVARQGLHGLRTLFRDDVSTLPHTTYQTNIKSSSQPTAW